MSTGFGPDRNIGWYENGTWSMIPDGFSQPTENAQWFKVIPWTELEPSQRFRRFWTNPYNYSVVAFTKLETLRGDTTGYVNGGDHVLIIYNHDLAKFETVLADRKSMIYVPVADPR